jgi:threonine dehydrogenase-like Zn-dependent dehydrogenase
MYQGYYEKIGMTTYPVIPGHEIVGHIEMLTDDAAAAWSLSVGARVAVEPTIPCGTCAVCAAGQLGCPKRFMYSMTPTTLVPSLWGGFAEYMLLRPGSRLHRVPEYLSAEDAALFNPIAAGFEWGQLRPQTKPGDIVVVYGLGQRGLSCVLANNEAGAARIFACTRGSSGSRIELAKSFGATDIVVTAGVDVPETIREATNGMGADVVIDTTPDATQPLTDAIELVRPGGKIVVIGDKASRPVPLIIDRLMHKNASILGVVGTGFWSYEQAIRVLSSNRYPVDRLHSHTFDLKQVELAMQITGGEVDGESALHVTVKP